MPKDTLPLHVRVRIESRDAQLERLGHASYSAYLKSDDWAEVRRRYREHPAFPQECFCGATDVQLHHRTYENVGRERLEDLVPLCVKCHQMLHALERRGEADLGFMGFYRNPVQAEAYRETRADRNALTPEEWEERRMERHRQEQKARSRARRQRKSKPKAA